MKFLMVILAVLLLGGCGVQREDIPLPSEMPSVNPSIMPSIMPSATATESPVALGVFITEILDTDPARVSNLQLCATALTGVRIEPGAEFSFNNTVGQRTSEKGYREAVMLVNGEREKTVGGGVCQISSTLYNAAAAAGMEILERHDHTGEVHYVEIGKDAAVSFGEQDFRFRNPLETPVQIEVVVENTEVKAVLYKSVTRP